uniref:serine C-palmitoyltransferase n=1 Tax=Auxenochlorella protothecoides TaxID=3075 RepID=A0A1D2AGU2_AUXPR
MGTGTLAPTLKHALLAYATWTILYIFGLLRDFVRNRRGKASFKGYAPIRQDFEDFFTRRIYYRIHDVFNCPVKGPPSAWMDIIERTPVNRQKPLMATGKIKRCLNLGSYNYLGFASSDPYCTPRVLDTLSQHGWSLCSSRADAGTTPVHEELERELASFLGKQAVLTCGMGFATNSVFLPVLAGPGTLVFSDALNHVSIVTGVRAAKGTVRVFDHNDPVHLEQLLRQAMLEGQPRTHRPWKKVIIVVEGIYSMEGEVVDLAGFVAVAKKYKAYIWLDEAHSIGAMGATGRGVCEHLGVSPADIDVLMGTFSKSFGACGGYVAANKDVIDYFMAQCPAHLHATAMTPPAVQMVLSALRLITGADGSDRGAHKLSQLRTNANYFRSRLLHMGFNVLGDWDSPVMPIMIFQLAKLSATSHEMLRLGVAVVVVGFPATPLLTSRMRVCISASHTRQDLDYALQLFDYVATKCDIRYGGPRAKALADGGPKIKALTESSHEVHTVT